ncbi:MAG TPA: hypothetical protein VGM06_04890 [Polyangiaceae bacterium]|jgi:hypothetical protein
MKLALLLVWPWVLGGCSRGSKSEPHGAVSATAEPPSAAPAPSHEALDQPQFSAPIGAATAGDLDVVAGLVVADGAVRVVALSAGRVVWTADALHGVAWAPDSELRVQGAAAGVALFWHGLRDGKGGRTMVVLGPHGEGRGDPIEVGTSSCATADGVAWIAPHAHGPTRVFARRWADPELREMVKVPADRDPSLVCGDHQVFVLGDGDDDVTASAFTPGDAKAKPPAVVLRESDFTDEEREHDPYTVGDDLSVVRVSASGAVALRDVRGDAASNPWRKLRHAVSGDDETVCVDGDLSGALVVTTHASEDACAGAGSTDGVRAIRVDAKSGEDTGIELSAADCDRMKGPFWIGSVASGAVVAWVERPTQSAPKGAPITGVAYRVLHDGGVREGKIEESADAVADGGCRDRGCFVAFLERAPGSDGMHPAPIRLFAYP